MPAYIDSTIDLNLPVVPEVVDTELFKEALKIYNALRVLANAVDRYTGEGEGVEAAQISVSKVTAEFSVLSARFEELLAEFNSVINVVNWKQPGELGETTPNTIAGTTITSTGDVDFGNDLRVRRDTLIDRDLAVIRNTAITGTLTAVAGFGTNGKTAQTAYVLPANATDLPTAIALVNALKAMSIANGTGA